MAEESVQTGFLLTADISGYTEFLTDSELEHAHDILRDLMRSLADALHQPLRIIKYEGDAVLCCAADGALADPTLILDLVEQSYVAFADRLFNIERSTTCTCRACANAKALDLKFFLHHGRYLMDDQGRGVDLSGADVILLHRLMKNRVSEAFGLRAYVLATGAALERFGKPPAFAPHQEEYEHFGVIACGVCDLKASLEARRSAREIRVRDPAATIICERIIGAPPTIIWDYFLDPAKRRQWDVTITHMGREANSKGRAGEGAIVHCGHGDVTLHGTMVDWKPFTYFTQEFVSTGKGAPPPFLMTVETIPRGEGQTLVRRLFQMSVRNPIKRLLLKFTLRPMKAQKDRDLAKLNEVLSGGGQASPKSLYKNREKLTMIR